MTALPATLPGGEVALERRVGEQRVKLLYGNAAAVTRSAVAIALLIATIAWPHAPGMAIGGWLTTVLLVQAYAQWQAFEYRRSRTQQTAAQTWGQRFAAISAVQGLVGGSAVFMLVPPDRSLTLALIATCLAGCVALSVITHAHYPRALYAMAVPVFGLLTLRYATLGDTALGALWVAVLGHLLLLTGQQSRAIAAQLRLVYEKEQLVEQLKQQNELAEQARDRAERASHSKSLFFAAASHDLRQPLHSLGLFAAALRNSDIDATAAKNVDQILACTESLGQLLDNLLDISKLDAGQVEVRPQLLPVNRAFLERLRVTYEVPAQAKGLQLVVHPSDAMLFTDRTLLYRVLSNLVSNAIRYTERGRIEVICHVNDQRATIEVRDTGIGIPADQHERIFEEFVQLDNPARDRSRGVGLGLATVRRIARLLEMPVHLQSKVGQGSSFSVEVPLADPQQVLSLSATMESKRPQGLLAGKLIVVIDDEESVRQGTHQLLQSWGCKCVAASDVDEALRAIDGRSPDFIIADLRLNGGHSGMHAIDELRAQLGAATPAVLISGDNAKERVLEARRHGLRLMPKPLPAAQLRALLNHEFAAAHTA